MTRAELLSRLECREMDLRVLSKDLWTAVQMIQGDEASRKLRHVVDSLDSLLPRVSFISNQVRDIPEWGPGE